MGFFDFGLSDLFGLGGDAISAAAMAEEGKKNRQFQERMYKHRHQYATEDMRKAGINPILAAASGQPTTAGSMANVPHMGQNVGKNQGRGNLNAAKNVMVAERGLKGEQAALARTQREIAGAQAASAKLDFAQKLGGWSAAKDLLGEPTAAFQRWQSDQNMPWQMRMGTSAG